MTIIGILLGLAGLVFAVISYVGRHQSKNRLKLLNTFAKVKLGDLNPVLEETKANLNDIGMDGQVKENVIVTGTPQVQQPLVSPISGTQCIYYKYCVTIVHTEYRTEITKDSNGNEQQVRKSTSHEDKFDQDEKFLPAFVINDGTGSIKVEPQKESFENLTKTVDKSLVSKKVRKNSEFRFNEHYSWSLGNEQALM